MKNKKIVVGYQGIEGAFSQEAMFQYFGEDIEAKNYKTFEDVFINLKNEEIEYGILPIENSTTGSINLVYDLLDKYDLFIVGEVCIKIIQNLIGNKNSTLENIKEIYSHPQGFEQSKIFIDSLSDVKHIHYHNTALSVKYIKDSNSLEKAAIGSNRACKINNLKILKENINDNENNKTRFIVIQSNLKSHPDNNKITVGIKLKHEIGSLYKVLGEFYNHKINLTKIESRPIGDGTFSYNFYIDLEGNLSHDNLKKALNNITKEVKKLKVYGSYKKCKILT
ncbi:prephenate dehydratase domain-containing protein [Cetobacterium sp. ZOR0034]|uniref:prephenate dehydratase n=1 Tax=Cetobacterium sp. ZOR0034 TaxID=1339239 RepID=UPI000648D4FB|nr:prephenate dehydratase domain-containing protein [Cetobacterium sp. ZOR0034]